ncbi:hypothetical protein [Nocardia sp. NPDC004604]|uniref:hypothetical protein n=1 Tax=Nocardia sp. NPDC004604 TaxID=3157013 RepID=UPI0033AE2F9A
MRQHLWVQGEQDVVEHLGGCPCQERTRLLEGLVGHPLVRGGRTCTHLLAQLILRQCLPANTPQLLRLVNALPTVDNLVRHRLRHVLWQKARRPTNKTCTLRTQVVRHLPVGGSRPALLGVGRRHPERLAERGDMGGERDRDIGQCRVRHDLAVMPAREVRGGQRVAADPLLEQDVLGAEQAQTMREDMGEGFTERLLEQRVAVLVQTDPGHRQPVGLGADEPAAARELITVGKALTQGRLVDQRCARVRKFVRHRVEECTGQPGGEMALFL